MVAIVRSILVLSFIHPYFSWTIITHQRAHNQRRHHAPSKQSTGCLRATPQEMGQLQTQLPSMGLNELQTQFRSAIAHRDLDAASLYRDELAERVSTGGDDETDATKKARLSWTGLGAAPWLNERLGAMGYSLPTTIQINAFEAVNRILENHVTLSGLPAPTDDTLEEKMEGKSPPNMGVCISGSTGSGKTLAFLVPTLSTLSQTLFVRERIRLKAEEDVGDVMGDLIDRIMVQASPSVVRPGYSQIGGQKGRSALTGAAMSSLGKSGTDVKSPVCLIVVPSRELGVQIALQMYELVGGNAKKGGKTESKGLKNFLKYKGPKGVKIGCVLDDEMSKEGLKLQTDVAITTPTYLSKLLRDGDVKPEKLRVVIFDEADLGLEQTKPEDLGLIFDNDSTREFSRISYLVGASVTESLGNLAVKDSILPEGHSFIATATKFAPLGRDDAIVESEEEGDSPFFASLRDLNLCLDPGLRHERVIAPSNTGLLCLARLLREEIREYEERDKSTTGVSDERQKELDMLREETNEFVDEELASSNMFKLSKAETISANQRPRVVIFFPDEDTARNTTSLLRDAVWGDHKLGVLLPNSGIGPLEIMEKFKNNELSVLLATPTSIRGLDFPALTHVYTLFLPDQDPREYLHLAGRVGRIGQQGSVTGQGGRVTTILNPEDASKYDSMANFLGFKYADVEPLKAEITKDSNIDEARRNLEDMLTLIDLAPDREVNEEVLAQFDPENVEEYDDDDDDDGYDDTPIY